MSGVDVVAYADGDEGSRLVARPSMPAASAMRRPPVTRAVSSSAMRWPRGSSPVLRAVPGANRRLNTAGPNDDGDDRR